MIDSKSGSSTSASTRFGSRALGGLALFLCMACDRTSVRSWDGFNVLTQPAPPPEQALGETPLDAADYRQIVAWGADWFRSLTFGNERTMTDVAGLLDGAVEIPCVRSGAPDCRQRVRVWPFVMAAIDDLDGVRGNLFQGNGGPAGSGYTSDLVLRFPAGTRLFGTIPVPEAVHTGLDVEAGSALPIGIVTVPVPPAEENLPQLYDLSRYGATGQGKVRLGLTCAVCHFSLDVDWDGKADLKSAWLDQPTPGSPYRPEDSWAIGNQDIHFGWLFSLSANPMLGFTVLSGPVGPNQPKDARAWVRWVRSNLEANSEAVRRAVAIGMLAQPRGWADDTPDALHNPTQFPSLFTHMNWPYNVDGVLINAGDRNNNVWTAALEFTGLIGLTRDRSGKTQGLLFWEQQSVYADLDANAMATVLLRYSPAVTRAATPAAATQALEALKADVLGTSDGVPGMLDPESVIVMQGLPEAIPKAVYDLPQNDGRRRKAADYGGDAKYRGPLVGMLGTRVRTPRATLEEPGVQAFLRRHPDLAGDPVRVDELVSESVSAMLNWVRPPKNQSRLLANAAALVGRGYGVFQESGCANCHRGPFFTDNLITPLLEIKTNHQRATATRPLQNFIAPKYDPSSGVAVSAGPFGGRAGYKTLTLRYLWGSAPYLHDGGVGVSLPPSGPPAGEDLRALLRRTDAIYGVGAPLELRENGGAPALRSDAALSLQALLLRAERARVLAANQQRSVSVPGIPGQKFAMTELGVEGVGHEYYIEDSPGGERISALVAFLLALDDCPGQHTEPPTACP